MKPKKRAARRLRIMAAVLAAVVIAYSIRMTDIQLINADYYVAQATDINTRTTVLKAARGEILDRYGRPFATTREGYNITLNRANLEWSKINSTLLKLTQILEASDTEWVDTLPMTAEYPYSFNGTEAQLSALKSRLGLNHYATAENCWDAMVERYGLTGVELSYQRRIAGLRYSMEAADFSISHPFTVAEDVSSQVMSVVEESGFALKGVETTVVAVRDYVDYELAPHIIGLTGPIYAEDWRSLKPRAIPTTTRWVKAVLKKPLRIFLRVRTAPLPTRWTAPARFYPKRLQKSPKTVKPFFLP